MTIKMHNICTFITKTCEVKCFNTLGFVNILKKCTRNEIYIFHMLASEILGLLLFLSVGLLCLFTSTYKHRL